MDPTGSLAARRVGAVTHTSGYRWCGPRGCPAVVSVIARDYAGGVLRSVVWCSLRGSEQHCAQSCLVDDPIDDLYREGEARPPL